jgi:hypothetical protein
MVWILVLAVLVGFVAICLAILNDGTRWRDAARR